MKTRIDIATVLARAQAPAPSTRAPENAPIPDTPLALLRLLRALSVTLRPDGNQLYVDITAGNVTRDMLEALRQHKEALLTMLEWFEERAGLLEYDGGLSRADAEREAWKQAEERYEAMYQPRDPRRPGRP